MHLSMRVPWRDRPWDGAICHAPTGNASCVLLANIGPNRDDAWENQNAGAGIDSIDTDRLPCLSERATFMSATGYTVVKNHPYAKNKALRGMLHPTPVVVPGYAFEAVPFRWLSREELHDGVGRERVPDFRPEAEDRVDRVLDWSPRWIMDGTNQRAVIDAFFEPIVENDSLVFVYLKHSPLQEQRTDRLLVGAARVTRVRKPPMWKQSGQPPFESSMWETIVEHSLRPDQTDGILLPYQQLVGLMDEGADVSQALAWAPEGRDLEFSYVTEHLTEDAAIQALASLEAAARGMVALGLEIPDSAFEWLSAETTRLWEMRGPAPGLAAVLGYLGVEHPHRAARCAMESAGENGDPWPVLEGGFSDPASWPPALRLLIGPAVGKVWARRPPVQRDALRLLSGLDISESQVKALVEGTTEIELSLEDLVKNPYWAAICTYGQREHVPFSTVDRACFPEGHVAWRRLVAEIGGLEDYQDQRRVQALLVDVLEAAALRGDTLLGQDEAIALANAYPLARAPELTPWLLEGLDLDAAALGEQEDWSPLRGIELADGAPGLKLDRLDIVADVIREVVGDLRAKPRLPQLADPRARIDAQFGGPAPDGDVDEEAARTEKAAGLAELHASPLAVLIGPAGTGKTTLLRALVDALPGDRVLLLAPTGKARVQLQIKVGKPAHTIASFLAKLDRFDGDRYLLGDERARRETTDLLVIDEASMLTEEMLAATLDAIASTKRLVLVGDPRQLPPIGAGRPFVDLVNDLRPEVFTQSGRVGPSYVELQVSRRQLFGADLRGRRADLALATWFGEGDAGDEHIWGDLAENGDLGTVNYVQWGAGGIGPSLQAVLDQELGLGTGENAVRRFAESYGASLNDKWINFERGAGVQAENWQILSPTRSRAFGTVELNRYLKRTYRSADLEFATAWRSFKIPRPVGPEQIVLGDKVMATQNGKRSGWPEGAGLNYVANGEIGVAIGRSIPRSKKDLPLRVEFSSQPGASYSYWPSASDENTPLELAWAVTVHKSQGSEFGTTILVLPRRAAVSRELMYTALTRQTARVVILHEGTLEELRELSAPWRSETARRLTDLFTPPHLVTLDVGGTAAQRYDGKVLHIAPGGVVVRSKNEVIIAMILEELLPGRWRYEEPLRGHDGRVVHPDFTFERPDGSVVYWEHLGMLDRPQYARTWALKRAWYEASGIARHPDRGPNGTLVTTSDSEGVDEPSWSSLARDVIGEGAPVHQRGRRRAGPGAGRTS